MDPSQVYCQEFAEQILNRKTKGIFYSWDARNINLPKMSGVDNNLVSLILIRSVKRTQEKKIVNEIFLKRKTTLCNRWLGNSHSLVYQLLHLCL